MRMRTMRKSVMTKRGGAAGPEPEPEPFENPNFGAQHAESITRPASPSLVAESTAASPTGGRPGVKTLHIGSDSRLDDRLRGGEGTGTDSRCQSNKATWRLRGGDGHYRWCEEHAFQHIRDHNKREEDLESREEDPEDEMQLPKFCYLDKLGHKTLCFCLCPNYGPRYEDIIPILMAIGVAIPTIGFSGWVCGTLLICDPELDQSCGAGALGWPFGNIVPLGQLGVALNGTKILLMIPLVWAVIWFAIVRPPATIGDQYRLRDCVRKCDCNNKCQACFEDSSLNSIADDSHHSKLEPLQIVNQLVLQPLSKNNRNDHWERAQSLWHFYLWFGYINLISTAIEPLACQRNDYGQYFMTAHGAESIECNWCTGDRDLRHAFPKLSEGAFTSKNFYGLFGLFGLFTVIPLKGYELFASLSMFCTVFYFVGIPVYFLHKLTVHRRDVKKRKFQYAFLTDKMREEYHYWEIAIIARKGLLAIFSTLAAGSPITMGLYNLVVMGGATFCHFKLRPYAHDDINRVEDLSLISTNMVLLVGLGGLALGTTSTQIIDQSTQDDRSALDLFNYVAMFVLFVHFVHTMKVMLNRLSQSVWQLREDGGCGCGWIGAVVLGAVFGAVVAVVAIVLYYETEIKWVSYWIFPLPSVKFTCDLAGAGANSCDTPSSLRHHHIWVVIVPIVVCAAVFSLGSCCLAVTRWCRCCNRRGRTFCCYGCHAGCGLCGNCTFPCFYPCCCAKRGCYNENERMRGIKNTCNLPQCHVECCEARRDMDQDEDNGEYWLDQLDKSVRPYRRLQQIDKEDEQTMRDTAREVLRKNKLELADVWTNYHVDTRWQQEAGSTEEGIKALFVLAEKQATELRKQALARETYVQDKELLDDDREYELQQAKHQKDMADRMKNDVDQLRAKQSQRQKIFKKKLKNKDAKKAHLEDEQSKAMKDALQARFQNEVLALLRKYRYQHLHRVLKDVERKYRSTIREKSQIAEALQNFEEDTHWQHTVLLYFDDKAEWRKMDQNLLFTTFRKGMSSTYKSMADELALNRFVNRSGKLVNGRLSTLQGWLRSEYDEWIDANDDGDDDGDVELRDTMSQTAMFAGTSVSRVSVRADSDAGSLPYGNEEKVETCGQKFVSIYRSLCTGLGRCTGSSILFTGVALAGLLTLAVYVFFKRGCCGKMLNGDTDGWIGAAGLSNTAWSDRYNLTNQSCFSVNRQREQNCTVSCKEGYVFSQGDIFVSRSNVFTCGGRYRWDHSSGTSVYEAEDGWWDRMFTPKWYFNSWIARGTWADLNHVPNETNSSSWYSRFTSTEFDVRKKQDHPFCWKDPCYHPNRLIDKDHTACGNNTRCTRVCADGSKPNVDSPGTAGGQQLCGKLGDENGVGKQPFNYAYPTVAICNCTSEDYEEIPGKGFARWPEKPQGGCRKKPAP
eukprot:COSAG02_NODE_452_length_22047_cov_20.154502_7_plen_1411_part_00